MCWFFFLIKFPFYKYKTLKGYFLPKKNLLQKYAAWTLLFSDVYGLQLGHEPIGPPPNKRHSGLFKPGVAQAWIQSHILEENRDLDSCAQILLGQCSSLTNCYSNFSI